MKLPLLLRFSDILGDACARCRPRSRKAMAELDYAGGYTAVYPIKVNQHFNVAGELAAQGGEGFGLEAGSKPELMAVLGLAKPGSIVICNGYKDREFIRLALIGRKLGLETFLVVEKPSELAMHHRGSAGARRAARPGRAHAPGVARRRQVAEQRRRQGQVRSLAAAGAGPGRRN